MARQNGIPKAIQAAVLAANLNVCCVCRQEDPDLEVRHIDGDGSNTDPANLAPLCPRCLERLAGKYPIGEALTARAVAENKSQWESECADAKARRAQTRRIEASVSSPTDGAEWLYSDPALAKLVGASVGLEIDDDFDTTQLTDLLFELKKADRLTYKRPETKAEYLLDRADRIVFERVRATKVVFPSSVLKENVSPLRELAVWVADRSPQPVRDCSEPDAHAGSYLYLVTPLLDNRQGRSFLSGRSALQVIANVVTGRPLFSLADTGEKFGQGSWLHPTEKLEALGAVVVAHRVVETLYRCRHMSDEQSSNDGERAFRAHDLLAYPLYISEPMVGVTIEAPAIERDETDPPAVDDSVRTRERARRAEIMARFKSEGKEQGIKITYPTIAKAAKPGKWSDRTPVGWWMSVNPKLKLPDAGRIERILTKSPRAVWPNG